jgi:hypothetical protein
MSAGARIHRDGKALGGGPWVLLSVSGRICLSSAELTITVAACRGTDPALDMYEHPISNITWKGGGDMWTIFMGVIRWRRSPAP